MESAELVGLGLPGMEEGEGEVSGGDAGEVNAGEGAADGGGLSAGQLARLRAVLVAAHPDAVPELIGGADVDGLLASVATARAAYARVREAADRAALAAVGRGGGTREADPAAYEGLSPEGKIAVGLGRGR